MLKKTAAWPGERDPYHCTGTDFRPLCYKRILGFNA